jgi:hypothetical protein
VIEAVGYCPYCKKKVRVENILSKIFPLGIVRLSKDEKVIKMSKKDSSRLVKWADRQRNRIKDEQKEEQQDMKGMETIHPKRIKEFKSLIKGHKKLLEAIGKM